jgi:hypothetical protein
MRKGLGRVFVVALCAVVFALGGWSPCFASQPPRPKLIVQITMDQLRGDLLRDYVPVLSEGFGRLESGFWIRRGDVNHAVTVSFPGHATLATGMYLIFDWAVSVHGSPYGYDRDVPIIFMVQTFVTDLNRRA